MNETFVVEAVRTPIGRYAGALAECRPDDLGAAVVAEVADRTGARDAIDEIYFGNANGAGEDNRNVGRMAGLLAGLPVDVPAVTLNRLCGSGMEAVIAGNRTIAVGDASIVIAGGVESMSRAPWVLTKPSRGYPAGHETLHSSTLGWRLINPKMPGAWTMSLGECTERLAEKYGISRDEQDRFAAESHQKAARAWSAGVYADEVMALDGVTLAMDESIRPDSTATSLGTLKTAFRVDGTVTAGNSSPLNDGAASVLLADERGIARINATPLARIVSRGVSAVEPQLFGIGPVEASELALKRAGISWSDLSFVELNEAFAAQSLAVLAEWPDLDPAIVNVDGGAIAMGHPLGCSGVRIVGHLARRLHAKGSGFGLATLCIGVGQGLAVVLEAA